MGDCSIEDFADDFGEPERKDEMIRMPLAIRMACLESRTPEKWHPSFKKSL